VRGWLPHSTCRPAASITLRQAGTHLTTGPFGTVLAASEYVAGGIPLVNPTHIANGRVRPELSVAVDDATASRLARHRLEVGDIVVGRHGDVGRSALISEVEAGWLCGSGSIAIRLQKHILAPRFVQWALTSRVCRDQLLAASKGATMDTINEPVLLGLGVPLWPVSTQEAIADFLDIETARIDGLITKKRRLIDLLEERKAATMLAAAGGRLTHAGPFERSSLAWLNERPTHWREVLIRLVAKTGSGHTPSRERPEWWEDASIPWITTGEVAQVRSDQREEIVETREKISEVGLANSAAALHPRGTVVLCRTASAGFSGIMGVDMATSQDFATWTCGSQLRPRYLLLCLRAMRPDLIGRLATGSTHKTIYMPDIHALQIPLPSLEEQDLAVEAAWRGLDPLFTAMDRSRQQLDLLQEHRQALITAAVTGELDVPRVAA
jgi:type I restriction enzyme S subunit